MTVWGRVRGCCWLWRWKKGPWVKECRRLLEARAGKTTASLLEPPEKHAPLPTSGFSPGRDTSDVYLQNCKEIRLWCFRSLSAWTSTTAATGNQYCSHHSAVDTKPIPRRSSSGWGNWASSWHFQSREVTQLERGRGRTQNGYCRVQGRDPRYGPGPAINRWYSRKPSPSPGLSCPATK